MKTAIDIGTRRELFIDDFLIESTSDASLRLSHPERREVVFVGDAPWEDGTLGANSVVREGDRLRLYYRASIPDMKDERNVIVGLAESDDGGRTFTRPEFGLCEFDGSKRNNILWRGGMPGIPPAFIDTNSDCPPETRFKGLVAEWEKLYVMGSGDGLRWHLLRKSPVDMPGTFDTVNTAFWDTLAECYRSYTRYFNKERQPGKIDGAPAAGLGARAIQMSTSTDFIHWEPPIPLAYRDGDGFQQMYTNAIEPCPGAEHIYVGFPNRIVEERKSDPDQPWPGVNDALFMASRDGLCWTRYRDAWIRPGLDPRNWTQRNNYPTWHIVESSPNEWSVLISEHYMQTDGEPVRLRRLAVRPWGFVSVHAGFDGGELLTKPLLFDGTELRLNFATSAAGSVQIELQNEAGAAVSDFGLDNMAPMFGDELDGVVRWQNGGDLSALRGRPTRLRISLKDADLYALRFQ